MDTVVRNLSKAVSSHDRSLFAKRDEQGVIRVLRKSNRFLSYEMDGSILHYSVAAPHDVFCLTDNWTIKGTPVEWGIEPVLARLKAIDLWNRPDMIEELINSYESSERSDARDRKNNIESFFLDFRRQFAKTFNHINTSTLDKKLDSRRKKEQLKWQS